MEISITKLKVFFNDSINFMSATNNIVQFIVFFMALLTVLYIFSMKHAHPIIFLLKPIGIKTRLIIKALIVCRKNPRKYIRIFCEYIIIKSEGQYKGNAWWNKTYQDFVAFFKDSCPDDFVYEIDNCTNILSEDLSKVIGNYFDYFDKRAIRKKYDLDRKSPIKFCMQIKIKQGFLSPNFLLSGLLARYKDDWGNLVNKYISSSCNETNSDTECNPELYFTFAWLLWGPSYQLKHQEEHFKLCQFAFGDESNSINVVLNNEDKLTLLWNEINKNSNGILCSLTCRLYKAKNYIDFYRENFSPYNVYFTNKVSAESTSFLMEPVDFDIKKDYKALNYYCTAYVWIMFESVTEKSNCFLPQNTITFFEHANLANEANYEFCINSLILKSFSHFDQIFSAEQNCKNYNYCLAMNKHIEEKFIEKLNHRIQEGSELSNKYRDCLIVKKSYSENDIFSSIDSFFSAGDDDYKFIEVSLNDKESITLLGQYYTSIYINAFPDVNERESLDSILDYLNRKKNGWYGNNNYHIFLLTKSDKVVAGLICDYFAKSNCGVIEFIAIKEEQQSAGLGTNIYQKSIEILRKDAINNGQEDISYIFCEIEKPNNLSITKPQKYLWFWTKLGYRKLLFDYLQPAIDSNKESVNSLDLIALPLNTNIKSPNGISVLTLTNFLLDYAKFAMRIDEPQNNIYIKKMIKDLELNDLKMISFEKIVQ